jgi:hypothetical protein
MEVIPIFNREIVNAKSTNFLRVITDSNPCWKVLVERTCRRISCNIFIINRLFEMPDMNVRAMVYCGLIYPLPSQGIIAWGQCKDTY